MRVTRSTVLGGAIAIAALICSQSESIADDACKQMQVYLSISPHHREDVMSYIAPRLQKDLGVELVTEAIGSAMMVDRVNAQANAPRITIAQWDVPIGIAACEKGVCELIDLPRAPNAQHLADWAYSKDKDGKVDVLSTGAIGVGFLYNADAFAKHNIKPPTSWRQLADSAYAGRLGLTAPQSSMGTAELVMLARLGGGGEANIDPGFAATKSILADGNTVFTWSSEMSNLLQLGDMWIAVNSSNLAPALRAQGLPIRFVWPEEGAPTVNSGLSIIKGAPCQAAAYEYINLYYSPEFQLIHMMSGGGLSPVASVWDKLTQQQMADLDIHPGDIKRLTNLDWQKINADRPGWIERWQREIH
jgi:putative spermidine/putrescine transport system substrate-binding protein